MIAHEAGKSRTNGPFVNPTLEARDDVGNTLLSFFHREGGSRQVRVARCVGDALRMAMAGVRIEEVFELSAVVPLRQIGILVDEVPSLRPTLRRSLPRRAARAHRSDQTFDSAYQLSRCGAEFQLSKVGAWGGPTFRYKLRREEGDQLREAEGQTSRLDPHLAESLSVIGAVGPRDVVIERDRQRKVHHQRNRMEFRERGFTIVRELFDDDALVRIAEYCRALRARGFLDGDLGPLGRRRLQVYDDSELRGLHRDLALCVSDITGTRAAPAYSFLAFCLEGGGIPMHWDPEGCPLSISVAIAAEGAAKSWPLVVVDRWGRSHTLAWPVGSGLVFDGHAYRHGRPPLPQGEAILLVLHYGRRPNPGDGG